MLNAFTMRKWAALIIPQLLAVVAFALGNVFYGLIGGVAAFLGALLFGVLFGTLLLRNPFSALLEGKGILALNLDSTGVITPFILRVQSPYIRGRVAGTQIDDVFDRAAVAHLAPPKINSTPVTPITEGENKGGVRFELDATTYNKGRFSFFHYPVILYNAQLKSVITKDWFSEKEKDAFAEHGVLYLNRKMEELTSVVRDFGRTVVELLKPKPGLAGAWWVWVILGAVFLILAVMFGPQLLGAITGAAGTTTDTVTSAAGSIGSSALVPLG